MSTFEPTKREKSADSIHWTAEIDENAGVDKSSPEYQRKLKERHDKAMREMQERLDAAKQQQVGGKNLDLDAVMSNLQGKLGI